MQGKDFTTGILWSVATLYQFINQTSAWQLWKESGLSSSDIKDADPFDQKIIKRMIKLNKNGKA